MAQLLAVLICLCYCICSCELVRVFIEPQYNAHNRSKKKTILCHCPLHHLDYVRIASMLDHLSAYVLCPSCPTNADVDEVQDAYAENDCHH